MRTFNLLVKRCADIIFSLLGLILLAPLLLAIALAVRASSPGPVLFKQKRLGKNGKPFLILKFRTMVVNAEHLGTGLSIQSENDERITRVGRFLRKSSLDELPQLLNVVAGSMSLVGPRPPAVYYPYNGYANYPAWAKKRFAMRPGITGLAQVKVRNSVSWDERIKLDNRYVRCFNLFLDCKILCLTAFHLFKNDDVYGK